MRIFVVFLENSGSTEQEKLDEDEDEGERKEEAEKIREKTAPATTIRVKWQLKYANEELSMGWMGSVMIAASSQRFSGDLS